MNFSINNFGFFPTNPDIYFDSNPIGGGTERPVGFTFEQMFKMYWTVKSFKIDASVEIPIDLLSAFLGAGGSSGTLLGSISGLSTIGELMSTGSASTSGKTKIITSFTQKNRTARRTSKRLPTDRDLNAYLWDGIKDNEFLYNVRRKTSEEVNKLKQDKIPEKLSFINSSPKEMSLLSAGPIHKGGGLTIDLSSIIFKNNLYWPKIIITFDTASSLASSGGVECIGGITIFGNLIPLYIDTITFAIFAIALGSIRIDASKSGRFFWDGKDDFRNKDNSIK